MIENKQNYILNLIHGLNQKTNINAKMLRI